MTQGVVQSQRKQLDKQGKAEGDVQTGGKAQEGTEKGDNDGAGSSGAKVR